MSGPEEKFEQDGSSAFEHELRQAMRPVDMRAETLAKFMALAEEAERTRATKGSGPRLVKLSDGGRVIAFPRFSKTPRWLGGAIAALLVLGVTTGGVLHIQHEREAARTQQQFEAAMRVTDRAFEQAQQQLQRAGLRLGD
ncbi:MAG TPA: hypothetical protein VGN16_18890 [Acidobacteriaceae bacterium]|jgi:hypothetical protein